MTKFQCGFCGKNYQRKSSLITHLLIHNPEVTIMCGICSNNYAHVWYLVRHIESKHGYANGTEEFKKAMLVDMDALIEHRKSGSKPVEPKLVAANEAITPQTPGPSCSGFKADLNKKTSADSQSSGLEQRKFYTNNKLDAPS